MSQPNDFKKENNNKNTEKPETPETKENKDSQHLPKNRVKNEKLKQKPSKPIPSSLIPPYGTDPFEKPESPPRPKHPFDTSFDTTSNLFKKMAHKKVQKLKKLEDKRAVSRNIKKK